MHDPEMIEVDIFRVNIKYPDIEIHQSEANDLKKNQNIVGGKSDLRSESRSELETGLTGKILWTLKDNELSKSEISRRVGHKSITGGLRKQIHQLLDRGLIKMTIPDKPQSRLQKYRLS